MPSEDDDPVTVADAPDRIEGLPPSCKLVWLVLANAGELTQAELVEETMLSPRTTRWALDRLGDAGVVASRPSTEDARQDYYSLQEREEAVSIADR